MIERLWKARDVLLLGAPFMRRDWSGKRKTSPHSKQCSSLCSHKPLGLSTKTMVNRGCNSWEEITCPCWEISTPTSSPPHSYPTSISVSISVSTSPSLISVSLYLHLYFLLHPHLFIAFFEWSIFFHGSKALHILFFCFNLPLFFSPPSNLLLIFSPYLCSKAFLFFL